MCWEWYATLTLSLRLNTLSVSRIRWSSLIAGRSPDMVTLEGLFTQATTSRPDKIREMYGSAFSSDRPTAIIPPPASVATFEERIPLKYAAVIADSKDRAPAA